MVTLVVNEGKWKGVEYSILYICPIPRFRAALVPTIGLGYREKILVSMSREVMVQRITQQRTTPQKIKTSLVFNTTQLTSPSCKWWCIMEALSLNKVLLSLDQVKIQNHV